MKRRILIDSKNCSTGECRVLLQEQTTVYNFSFWKTINGFYMICPIQDVADIYFDGQFHLRSEE